MMYPFFYFYCCITHCWIVFFVESQTLLMALVCIMAGTGGDDEDKECPMFSG